jgi:hypothetical protein
LITPNGDVPAGNVVDRIECQPILCHACQRRADGLMRSAFGCQCHARRRANDHETRVLITSVVERIEAAMHERIEAV